MADELQAVTPGGAIYSSDLNQLLKAFLGLVDVGSLTLFAPLAAPAAPTLAAGASGSPNGTYTCGVVYVTGVLMDNGTIVVQGLVAGATASVAVASKEIQWTWSTPPTGTVAVAGYRYGVITPPPTALTLTQVADATSTIPAATYNVNYALGNAQGVTTAGSSNQSTTIPTSDAYDIRFAVTLPTAATYIIVGWGPPGTDSQFAKVTSAGAVTYIGTNSAGVSATVNGSTLTVTIKAYPTDTAIAMPTTNDAYLTANGATAEFAFWSGSGTTTTWTDDVADASLGTGMPTSASVPPVIGNAIPAAVPTSNTTGTTLGGNFPEQYIPLWWYSAGDNSQTSTVEDDAFIVHGTTAGTATATALYTLPAGALTSQSYALDAWMHTSVTSIIGYAVLWDVTAGVAVSASELSTSASGATHLRSGAFTLTPGHEYGVALWVSAAGDVYATDISLVVLNA